MSSEDEMVQSLIDDARNDTSNRGTVVERRIYPVAQYNHYGTRGVADLYVQEDVQDESGYHSRLDYIYEVKSESAIKQASGANEIIRQYNRMRKNFYKDESRKAPDLFFFELVIIPSTANIDHFIQNFKLYREANRNNLNPNGTDGMTNFETICFRHPDDNGHIQMFREDPENGAVEALEEVCGIYENDIAKRVRTILRTLGY